MKISAFFLLVLTFASSVFGAESPIVISEFVFNDAPFSSCHAPTIAETEDGSLVVAWFAGDREGAPNVAIWSSRLEKGSSEWSEPRIIADADEEGVPCWNPVLFQPSNEPLFLFFKQGNSIARWRGVLQCSEDSGKTWKERLVLPEGFIGPVKNKPFELPNGEFICPTSTENNGWLVHFEFARDFYEQWTKTPPINSPSEGEAIQPSILSHKDGKLQAICRNRNGNGQLWQTWSKDFGKTWSKLSPLPLPNPCSGIDATGLQDGRFLLVYNHATVKTGSRNVLNVAISDNGEDWRAALVLENSKGEYSYPSVLQTKDGTIQIVYTWRREKIKRVVLDPSKIKGEPIQNGNWPNSVE